jgi:uncharacterized membrane protein SirB2
MNTAFLFPAFLTLHLIALVIMAGTTLIDFISYRTYWKLYDRQKEQAAGVLRATANFSRLTGIGAGLLVSTGVGMIALTHGLLAEQLWFKIKFGFVLILIVNGLLVGRRQGVRLRKVINEDSMELPAQVQTIRQNLNRSHIAQLIIFCIIIFLSAYKFN